MEENKVHFRHLMLFFYRKAERTVRKWLSLKLVISILKIKKARIGPLQMKIIKTLIKNNAIRHSNLTKKNLDRISICNSLYKRNEETPFLKQIVTRDEKWIIHNNVERKRSWRKRNEPPQKPVFVQRRSGNNTEIEQKHPEIANWKSVVFHQDNVRPHVSLITRQKLLELSWDVLPHPSYLPNLASSDFLFRSLQNSLNGKSFNSLVKPSDSEEAEASNAHCLSKARRFACSFLLITAEVYEGRPGLQEVQSSNNGAIGSIRHIQHP
ncbi:PREDICTED: histone-lysine N-methyltransferase SETMAR-like [Atta cephalotes]|uniref:Histone-lysine N-methyltransferase SETMAR n=1 Tax=Atta cephalotes TaxID=12957 RepID=A0A158NYA8_ATTCE|nr:PREDICTED: histone-lysine N-methyltransferase SETMAR-like [Atta cephalotes]